jgi:prolyl-tRNA editing enzyme YbaK/EbsC (Cys-tRNA(Pro) deacylase)
MHPNVRRVQDALVAAGIETEVRHLAESTHTAAEAAAVLGVEVAQIAKSLLFLADGRPVVVVARGSDRVDTDALALAVHAHTVKRPDAAAVKSLTGFSIGGVSPAGLPDDVEVVIDRALGWYETVWAAAGTPFAVYPTTLAELVAVSRGRVEDVRQG